MTDSPADRVRRLSELPIWVAPMAGGPSTPGLVIAAARSGAFGFIAGGYKTAETMLAEISAVRAAGVPGFGVNVFVPGEPARDPGSVSAYVATLRDEARPLGAAPGEPSWDDDHWADKLMVLMADRPLVVSFTFGCPSADVVRGLQDGGTLVAVTVTDPGEAASATAAGADLLCVQGPEAGAHRGTFTNPPGPALSGSGPGLLALIGEVAAVTDLPLVAAGGIADARGVAAVLAAGAAGVQAGTAFLRCPESGTHPVHKVALADPRFTSTEVTRAFSGRPARAVVNKFLLEHEGAPAAYPEINNATRPLRAAAAASGDPDRVSLYAGTGFRSASDRPAAEVIGQLAAGTR
jgi:nitronate monooxygenase